jgi:hypothetical protein
MVAIQWRCIIELVFVMERFYSCIIMVLGWVEGRLKSLVIVRSRDFVVVGNGYNPCYKEWCFRGTDHFDG